MFIKDWKKDICTIPNLLSLFRLALIPVYIVIYLRATSSIDYFLAAGILAVSCLTDMIDGKIARRYNMSSTFGQFLDPLADKATQFSLILCLALKYSVLWYLIGLFIAKESFQFIAAGIFFKKGKMLKGALISGKICTTILFLSLILMVMIPTLSNTAVNIIAIIDAFFMLIAFVAYILAYTANASKLRTVDTPTHEN